MQLTIRLWRQAAILTLIALLAAPLPGALAQQAGCEYTVQPGDSVIGIATRFGMQPWELQELNQTRYYEIWQGVRVGWVLTVCPPGTAAPGGSEPAAGSEPSQPPAGPPPASDIMIWANDTLKIRSGPGTTYPEVGKMPYGQSAPALGRNAESSWLYIDYNGTRGWVAIWLTNVTGHVSRLPVVDVAGTPGGGAEAPPAPPAQPPSPPEPQPAGPPSVRTTSALRIRSGPGSNFAELGRLPMGLSLSPLGRNADASWAFIEYSGVRGWIAAWLTEVSGDLNSLPVTTESGSGGSAPTPSPALPPSLPPSAGGGFELGGQTHSLDHPNEMRAAGMTWVKFQHKWSPGQSPKDLVGRIEQAHANGLRVLFSVPGPEYPSSIDFAAYVQFVSGAAALGADGIEIWNEMNLDREWPTGQISPAAYVQNMLAPAYNAIKAANPGTLVIAGALAPTGVDNGISVWSDQRYLAGMRDAGAARYMDCLGVHHNAGATPPDAATGHPADGGDHHYSWYFPLTFNVYAGAFPGTKLCFTELGYASPEGWGAMPPNFWWAGGNTVGEQTEWLARAVDISQGTGRVRLLIVFNVDFTYWGDDPQAGYAIIRPGGGCPACDSLRRAMSN